MMFDLYLLTYTENIHFYLPLSVLTSIFLTCVASSSTVFFSMLTSSSSGPSVSISIGLSEPTESMYIKNCVDRKEEEVKMSLVYRPF